MVKKIFLQCRRPWFDPWVGKIPWRRKSQPTLVFLRGEFHGQRSLAGCSPWVWSWTRLSEYTTTLTLRDFPGGPVAGSPQGCGCGRGQETKTSADRTAEPVCSGAGTLQPEEPVRPQLEKACAAKANKQINNTQ